MQKFIFYINLCPKIENFELTRNGTDQAQLLTIKYSVEISAKSNIYDRNNSFYIDNQTAATSLGYPDIRSLLVQLFIQNRCWIPGHQNMKGNLTRKLIDYQILCQPIILEKKNELRQFLEIQEAQMPNLELIFLIET